MTGAGLQGKGREGWEGWVAAWGMKARARHILHENGSVTQNGCGDRKHRLGVRSGAHKEKME